MEVWGNFGHYPPYEVHIPVAVATIAGYIAELVRWVTDTPTMLSRGSVVDACATGYCSGKKARDILGYKPRVGIEEGIRISCDVSIEKCVINTVSN